MNAKRYFGILACFLGEIALAVLLSGHNCNGDSAKKYDYDLAPVDWCIDFIRDSEGDIGWLEYRPIIQNVGKQDFNSDLYWEYKIQVKYETTTGFNSSESGMERPRGLSPINLKVGERAALPEGLRYPFRENYYYIFGESEVHHPNDQNDQNKYMIGFGPTKGSEIVNTILGKKECK